MSAPAKHMAYVACIVVAALAVAMAVFAGAGRPGAPLSAVGTGAPARPHSDMPTSPELASTVIGRSITMLDAAQAGRRDNVALAARTIDGVIVGPGKGFSFNKVVGERTAQAGYVEARVIIDGRNEPGLAGGICQVSSTLYNAALLAGMKITERHAHSRPVPYLTPGLDATVAYGSLDLKWSNPWDFPVTVRAGLLGSGTELEVVIEAMGVADVRPPSIRLISEIVEVVEPRPAGDPGPTGRPIEGAPMTKGTVVELGQPGYGVKVWAEWDDAAAARHRELVSYDFYEPVSAVAR